MNAPPRALASPREQAARLPLGPGVYRFRDAAGRVLYLGRTTCLRRRAASYWGDLGDRPHLAAMVARIERVEAVPCASAHEATWLERNLLERRKPPWNRSSHGGQEAELEAVDWITAEQKVTSAQPSDFDVHGWAGGVPVCFEVRRGRVCGWTQQGCAVAAARRHVTSPPEDRGSAWADFARQAAELAALLTS